MAAPMIPVVVLIVCKTVLSGPEDQNSSRTGWENRDWAYENSKMVCTRQEVQMFDQAEAMGAAPQTFNSSRCMAAAIRLGAQWDVDHKNSSYRTWRVACPTPIINDKGEVVGWKLPECGHQDTVMCEQDSVI